MIDKLITPSILNVEKEKRLDVLKELLSYGIKWIHYDIMDGKFVPNDKAISVEEIKLFHNKLPSHLSDAHLMVSNPFDYAKKITDYVTCLTVHYEAFDSESEIIKFIDEFSSLNWIGLAIKPSTKFEDVKHILYLFDLVLIMSVEPGFGGQAFIEDSKNKIQQIFNYIKTEKLQTIIQVDGGLNDSNSKTIFDLGSSLNVVGSYLINNLSQETIKKLK